MAILNLHKLIDHLIGQVFEAEDRRLTAWVDKLCTKNLEFAPKSVGFIYNGERYRPSNVTGQLPRCPALDHSLWPEMDSFLKDQWIVNMDKAFIRQSLVTALEPCNSEQDIRDALPDILVEYLPQLNALPRTREEAFTLQNNPRHLRQFAKVRAAIDVYASAKLIY